VSDRLDRYFAQEATEYLDQLDEELAGEGRAPDLAQLLRLVRGVHGSARMAGAESVARVAERLEAGIRLVQGGQVAWSDDVARLSRQTVADLKVLVRASGRWSAMDDGTVRRAIERWNELDAGEGGELRMTWQEALPDPTRGRPGAAMPEVAIESLFFDDGGPHVLNNDGEGAMNQPGGGGGGQPVPIETLLLDATGAAREAVAMRDDIERLLRGVPGADVELGPVMRELFELLEIAAAGDVAAG
jgi:HPt (histidine-containing phosphotransfer) domain-containing protein